MSEWSIEIYGDEAVLRSILNRISTGLNDKWSKYCERILCTLNKEHWGPFERGEDESAPAVWIVPFTDESLAHKIDGGLSIRGESGWVPPLDWFERITAIFPVTIESYATCDDEASEWWYHAGGWSNFTRGLIYMPFAQANLRWKDRDPFAVKHHEGDIVDPEELQRLQSVSVTPKPLPPRLPQPPPPPKAAEEYTNFDLDDFRECFGAIDSGCGRKVKLPVAEKHYQFTLTVRDGGFPYREKMNGLETLEQFLRSNSQQLDWDDPSFGYLVRFQKHPFTTKNLGGEIENGRMIFKGEAIGCLPVDIIQDISEVFVDLEFRADSFDPSYGYKVWWARCGHATLLEECTRVQETGEYRDWKILGNPVGEYLVEGALDGYKINQLTVKEAFV